MRKFSLAILGFILLACSGTPPTQFYTLDAVVPPQSAPQSSQLRSIGIGPVALPALLNRKAIVSRGPQLSIQVSDTQQWAEPLLDNITRVITRNLSALKPQYLFHAYPWTAFGSVDTRMVFEITRFEAQLGKGVYFDAVWSIKDEAKGHVLKQSRTTLERPLKSQELAEMVTQMNDILASFSRELSQALDKSL